MSDTSSAERLVRLAHAGWNDVSDRILAGLCHDLNGRVTSLAGMVQLLQFDEEASSMAPFLDEEVQRLEESVRQVRMLAGEPEEEPEPIHLPEVLPSLLALFSKHRHMEGVETQLTVRDGLIPVLGRWTLTGRAILLALSAAGWEALHRDRTVTVLAEPANGAVMQVLVRARGPRREIDESPPKAARTEGMSGIAELLEGGWVEREFPDGIEFGLELPALRRRS